MLIEVNGESLDVLASLTIGELIKHLALAPERLAIELNRKVVRRADWQQIVLKEGDRVEIVHFVGGGIRAVTSDENKSKV
ncbi:MAG TPA: sulfur carrier protein ThiS [Pyrinomonadaceae bacterium]|nr:sulfur carrier protein ThiS [Pyrinomonadaceae bacterium]